MFFNRGTICLAGNNVNIFNRCNACGPLKGKPEYQLVPLSVGLHWNLNPLIKEKLGIGIKGECDLIVEPFINTVIAPDTNIEVGSNFLLRYMVPFNKVKPYLKVGVGALYMTQHTREQSTQYNFLPQFGGGIAFRVDESTALNFEYRFRHLSNASFKEPNNGIDTDMFLIGLEFSF